MIDDEKLNEDELLDLIPLENSTKEVANSILNENDPTKLKTLTDMFNLNQAKKNVLRVLKFNSLLDKVSDQMLARFNKHPGEFSNSELLNYLTVTQNAIDRANKSLSLVETSPAIQINQINITNESPDLSRESSERIMEAVQSLLNKAKEMEIIDESETSDIEYTVLNEENDNE